MFEHHRDQVIPRPQFVLRLAKAICVSLALVVGSLAIGAVGYHSCDGMAWLDSWLNASMILMGMGPATELQTEAGKVFAIAYSLYSGLAFVAIIGTVVAPVLHRILHQFHQRRESDDA